MKTRSEIEPDRRDSQEREEADHIRDGGHERSRGDGGIHVEALEDVQLAVDTLIAAEAHVGGGDMTVEVRMRSGGLDVAVGPFDHGRMEAELARDVAESDGIGLGRLLGTVMGGYELEGRDGGGWVRMHKPLHGASGGPAA